jgi:hypothetical protein
MATCNVAVEFLACIDHSQQLTIGGAEFALCETAVSGGITHDVVFAICLQLFQDGANAEVAVIGVYGVCSVWVR